MISRRGFSTSARWRTSSDSPTSPSISEKTTKSTAGSATTNPAPALPHLTPTGTAHMVSVSNKAHTIRTAIATGTVRFSNPTPLTLIRSNGVKKGDVLAVSRIAGIMAAKKCPDLIPLCHPIMITHVGVDLAVIGAKNGTQENDFGAVVVEAKVQCQGQTGVEMEALTSVMGAALSVVDMCKAVDKGMSIGDVRVVLKEGGRSGVWKEEGWGSVVGMGGGGGGGGVW
ncbi:MoaC-domain-containing protein [Massarina eburnea CBS 473.64]|uniref:cyclic pyranopterin monophosphate synthase n=1 Tax=Massarina eburnea CBS 473.64 TaxID=1395130 RepID=A0A6A6S792_9PLEO|nr:MoaC-domain-containing protein [Massarina eburnea CBS 473.64]